MVEAVREGYLLHYGEPRLLAGHDADLALLAGDYLYALGIDRLAALGDPRRSLELADLISRCAQLPRRGPRATRSPALVARGGASRRRGRASSAPREAIDSAAPEAELLS